MITLDNSAFSMLYCERQYELRVKRGLIKSDDSQALLFGNALHKAMEYSSTGDDLDTVFNKVFADFALPDSTKLVKAVGALLQSASTQHPPIILDNCKPAIEVKFNYLHEPGVTLCGTIDRIELDPGNNILVIRDFKTAGDASDYKIKEKLDLYRFSFQLPFYVHALLSSGILPASYRTMLLENNYRAEYTVVFHNISPIKVKTVVFPAYPDDYIYKEVPRIIQHRVEQAKRIHATEERSPMTGLNVYAGCKYCDFQRACLAAGTELETEVLGRFDIKQYDPMSFR